MFFKSSWKQALTNRMKRRRSVLCQDETVNKAREKFAHPNLAGRKRKTNGEVVQEIVPDSEVKKANRNKVTVLLYTAILHIIR